MTRAMITGATGAIGTALIKDLISQNVEVLVLTRRESERNNSILKHPLVKIMYCSLAELCELRNNTGKDYDVFYHFAWEGTSGEGRNDMHLQNRNVTYALDAVKVAKAFGCHTFIGAGSQAEYGRVEGVLKPDTATFPENGYGYAKLCAGLMTRDYAHLLGLKHIWVRVLSVYGPNDGAKSMVRATIEKLRKGIVPEFTKAEQMWDYLYSEDAAEVFRLLGDKGIDGKVYVLGSGEVRPLKDYIHIIRDVVSPKSELKIGVIPYSEKQVMYLCADVTELKRDIGWKPKVVFEEGIKKCYDSLS